MGTNVPSDLEWQSSVGIEPTEERKLVRIPRCAVELRVECRWFEEERGCPVQWIEVPDIQVMLVVMDWVKDQELGVKVGINAEVREGHVVLGGRISPSD